MKLAIMQPYFFPYIGYFQLCYVANKFVFLDDVNFINKGWINRNRILLNNDSFQFTIPLKNASQNRKINSIELAIDEKWQKTFYKTLEQTYKNAPYYSDILSLIQKVFVAEPKYIGNLAKCSIKSTCKYLGLSTEFIFSSAKYNNHDLKGQQRILSICTEENASK